MDENEIVRVASAGAPAIKQVLLIVLGSVLAFTGGLVAYFIRAWYEIRTRNKNVKEFLIQLLENYMQLFPRIEENYKRTQLLLIEYLNQIGDDLALYERNQEHVILMADSSIRSNVLSWFSQVKSCLNYCRGLTDMALKEGPNQEFARTEIKAQVEKLGKFQAQAETIISQLKSGR